jgi:hypothetical protein
VLNIAQLQLSLPNVKKALDTQLLPLIAKNVQVVAELVALTSQLIVQLAKQEVT